MARTRAIFVILGLLGPFLQELFRQSRLVTETCPFQ